MDIAILASGNGTNAQVIIDKSKSGALDVDIKLILSDNPKAKVIERAREANIPFCVLDHNNYEDRLSFDSALTDILRDYSCKMVVLAGYMRLLSAAFLDVFPGSVVNIHPALLPSFRGAHGIRDALDYGVKITGATVHFVEEKVDSGPVIIQAAVPVLPEDDVDTLQNRIHALEYRIYPQALQWLAEDRITIEGRKVILAKSSKTPVQPDGDWFVWPPLEDF